MRSRSAPHALYCNTERENFQADFILYRFSAFYWEEKSAVLLTGAEETVIMIIKDYG